VRGQRVVRAGAGVARVQAMVAACAGRTGAVGWSLSPFSNAWSAAMHQTRKAAHMDVRRVPSRQEPCREILLNI